MEMFVYYLDLAWRRLRRDAGLSALMVIAIGFGVAATMTTYAVFRAVTGDPIPGKSSRLFVPQIDGTGPEVHHDAEPDEALTYIDAMALMRAHRARRQSAMYAVAPVLLPTNAQQRPIQLHGHAVESEFFPMLEVPFKYGRGWSADDDRRRAPVAVINGSLNRTLFGGVDSVGRTIHLQGVDYRIVGVMNDWNPQPRYYDTLDTAGFATNQEDILLPFGTAVAAGIDKADNYYCTTPVQEPGLIGLQRSSCVWITYLAELDSPAEVTAYRQYLDDYAEDQRRAGRFNWAPNNRLRNVPDWLDYRHVVPPDTKLSLVVALGLFAVCLVNTVGLLLARFLRREGEIGVRRALGAPRRAIYAQHLTEAGVIGLAGGLLGLALTSLGLVFADGVLPEEVAALVRLDAFLLMITLVLAVAATLLAGLYPTYRAAQVPSASQLKVGA